MNPRNNGARRALPESCNRPALTAISDPPNREAYRSQAAVLAEAVARCRADDASGLVEHLDSVSVARDAAAVREMLGEDEVSLLAWSYGGVPAVAYARLHPGRIRAVVFDDTIDQTAGPSGVDDVLMPSIEENFPRFAAWCADDDSCALHGQDVRRTWHALIERTTRRPVTYTSPGLGTIRLSDLHLRFFGGAGMPSSSAWPSLAGAIADAAGGDFSWFGEQALQNSAAWTAPGFLAMRCPDGLGYHGYDAFVAGRKHAERISPGFGGGATGWESLACAGWRRAAANPPRPLPAGGFPPALGIGGYSNYATTAALVRKITGSVSVPYEGSGHVMYLSGNRCMTGHADRYLAELRLPRAGTVCGPAG
jgi:pimeloyl-ACP methyl ester carboxylesterase